MATLDVRNAFESIRWDAMNFDLGLTDYLQKILEDYLRDHSLTYENDLGVREKRTCF